MEDKKGCGRRKQRQSCEHRVQVADAAELLVHLMRSERYPARSKRRYVVSGLNMSG